MRRRPCSGRAARLAPETGDPAAMRQPLRGPPRIQMTTIQP
ncbi:MAG: hypothetical protein HONDAALG_00593 [Gammaproteobacteria bacterium]|nr:hypothetical protein [Gammaproteobacteria bacterium]